MIATGAIGDTVMTVMDATSDTAMPEGADTPGMIMTSSRMVCVGATAEIATRVTDVNSGEKTSIRGATVARKDRETAFTGAGIAGLPRGKIRNGCR